MIKTLLNLSARRLLLYIFITLLVIQTTFAVMTAVTTNRQIAVGADAVQTDTFSYPISEDRGSINPAPATVPAFPHSQYHSVTFTYDRSNLPPLYYREVTSKVYMGAVTSVTVQDANGVEINSTYDSETGYVQFTTDTDNVTLVVENLTSLDNFGNIAFTTLKDDKSWAWSHGMDDNVYLQAQIAAFKAVGWRATLFLIVRAVDDTRDQDWIDDAPDIYQHLNDGWAIGNHGWNSECLSRDPPVLEQDVLAGYNRLAQLVAASNLPGYKVVSFAAPCFVGLYHQIILDLRDAGTIPVLFNESAGSSSGLQLVDNLSGGASDYTQGTFTAAAITFDTEISRNIQLGIDNNAVLARMDWASVQSNSSRHIWFNTLSHGNQEDDLGPVITYIYNTYGPGGTDELWMAPSDEIYSYLIVRDNTQVTMGPLTPQP